MAYRAQLYRAALIATLASLTMVTAPMGVAFGQEAAPRVPVGKILKAGAGEAIISLGEQDGLAENEMVEFFVRETDVLSDAGDTGRERVLGLGRIIRLAPRRAKVAYGLNVQVPPDASVRPLEGGASLLTRLRAERPQEVVALSAALRPIIPGDVLGVAALAELGVTVYLEAPVSIAFRVDPLGLALSANEGRSGALATFLGEGIVSFDSLYFAIGLGVGAATLAPNLNPGTDEGGSLGFLTSQNLRIGATDGFNFWLINRLAIYNEAWNFGGITVGVQAPLGSLFRANQSWLQLRAGGNIAGAGYFEFGIRTLVSGNGTAGSLFVTPTFGVGVVAGTVDCREDPSVTVGCRPVSESFVGPMMGVGVEYRL